MSFSERRECTGRSGPFTWQQRHRLSQKRAYTLSKWKNPRWLCGMLSWDIHSWAAQLSFSEEGLLWSTWKATQGRVLPRENPKKELNTTNVASSFYHSCLLCLPERSRQTSVQRARDSEARMLVINGEMMLWAWATWGSCCPVSQWVLSSLPFRVVLWCPAFLESKRTDSNVKDVMMRTASFWESEAWTLWLSELQSLQQAKKHQAEWMESLWWVCYELRNCKQTWHASSGAQQNLHIAQC